MIEAKIQDMKVLYRNLVKNCEVLTQMYLRENAILV